MNNKSDKRQSRHKRSKTPSVLIIQKRDIEIIKAVFQYRYLTRSQIQLLFDMKSVTRVNIRLRKLYNNRFLDRYYQPTLLGSSEAIYTIGSCGIQIVAESSGMALEELKRRRRIDKVAKNKFINHNLAVNDFRINLMVDIKNHSGFNFIKWLDSRDCEFKFKYKQANKEVTTSIKPDGYFEFIYQNCSYSFFVEIDLSTSNHSKLKSKFNNYLLFKNHNLFKQEFGKEIFYVLVITKNKSRTENLHRILNELRTDMFWFSTVQNTPNNILLGNIWKQSGRVESRAFFKQSKVRIVK
ncbi:MAG: replication-relaxation family protein [Methanosarcinaceae archaeon]